MKTITTLAAIATLLSVNVFAQTGPAEQVLTISVSSSNLQYPSTTTIEFEDLGSADFDNEDTTLIPNHNIIVSNDTSSGPTLGDTVPPVPLRTLYPFTISTDNIYIDKYDTRDVLDRTSVFQFGIEADSADTVTINASSFMYAAIASASYNVEISFVYLKDLTTGISHQILNNTITLAVPSNQNFAMNYELTVMAKPSIQTFPVTCFGSNNGVIAIHSPYSSNWNFTVYPLQSATVSNPDTTLYGFISDFYTVTVYVDGLLADSEKVHVDSPDQILPYFIADNYSVYTNDPVLFMNTTSGADTYNWTFGDNTTDSILNPTHSFLSAGNYPVTVTATNLNGCNASFTDTIFVADPTVIQGPTATRGNTISNDPTGRLGNSPDVKVISGSQKITVNQNGEGQEILVQIMNVNGQLINSTSTMNQSITFDFLQAGIYLVTISSTNGEMVSEKIIVNN